MGQPAAARAGPTAAGAVKAKVKPALRGVSHTFAAVAALAAGVMLIISAPSSRARLACTIYTAAVTSMLAVSAVYHVPTWPPRARRLLGRADHSTIYLQIAGTYTPICMLGLAPALGTRLLATVWAGAVAGVTQSAFFPHAPKAVGAFIYVVLGWAVVPYAAEIKASMPTAVLALLVAGGLLYSIGAAVYAARWPDPAPETFGYHEIFHALVVLAAGLHFAAVYLVAHAPRPLNKP